VEGNALQGTRFARHCRFVPEGRFVKGRNSLGEWQDKWHADWVPRGRVEGDGNPLRKRQRDLPKRILTRNQVNLSSFVSCAGKTCKFSSDFCFAELECLGIGYERLSRFCCRNLYSTFFNTNSFNPFHLQITEDYNCIKLILICLFYHLIFLCRRFYSKSFFLIRSTWTVFFHFCHFQNKKSPDIIKFFISFGKPTRYWKVIAPLELNSHKLVEKVCAFS